MDKLYKTWRLLDAKGKQSMADRLFTHKDYLSQLAHGHRNPGKHFEIAIIRDIEQQEKASA